MREDIKWYVDRIYYYRNILEENPIKQDGEKFRLYGPLEEYADRRGIRYMYEFWVGSLEFFIADEMKKKLKGNKKDKKDSKDRK